MRRVVRAGPASAGLRAPGRGRLKERGPLKRLASLALGLLALGGALATPLAAAGPADAALLIVRAEVMCALIGVDEVMLNVFGPMAGGSYPGRSGVQILVAAIGPDGTVGRPVDDLADALGGTWDTVFGVAVGSVIAVEQELARQGAEVARVANDGYAYLHVLKCWATDRYLLPSWDANVKPIGDCWFGDVNGGVEPPMLAWIFGVLQRPGIPPPPPRCATFVPTYVPPLGLPPLP